MKLQGILRYELLAAFIVAVDVSPISSEDITLRHGDQLNRVEDLFFMSETEEQSFDRDSLNNSVIEKVKARILKSLHLKAPPKSHAPIPLLQYFQSPNQSWKDYNVSVQRENNNRTTKSEFLTSEIVPNTCFHRNGPKCLRFQIHIPKHVQNKKYNSVEMWLFKERGVTEYTFAQITDDPNQAGLTKTYFSVSNQTASSEWTRFDATDLLDTISSNILDIEVSSTSKRIPLKVGKDKNPFLIVRTDSKDPNNRVKKAAVDCEEENSACCRKKVYISFKDVGWDNWIVQPEGYNANICKGSCNNRLDLADKHHAHVLMRLISKANENLEVNDSIHCSPKLYKPLSIIYLDEKGLKVITNLADMSVSECSCS